MAASITFYGGADTVTGANFLFDAGDVKLLIDCGALEREHEKSDVNNAPFGYDPRTVDALLVTHAHADHIGRIPKLVHDGFKGTIYSTPATRDLAAVMFEDALVVMEREMQEKGVPMMYQAADVTSTLALWRTRDYHEQFSIRSAHIEFSDAGHILGSAMVKITRDGHSVLFTGDIGNSPEPLLRDTEVPEDVQYLVMESVYGDRLHEDRVRRADILRAAIEDARRRKGTLLIPSFSIERTQVILYEIDKMITEGKLEPIPVYFDAPLAERVTEVFSRYVHLLNPDAQTLFHDGVFRFKELHAVHHSGESVAIHKKPDPKIIVAGAGMSNGGRIRAHEKQYLPDKNASVLLVGYQAPGSLGRRIQERAREVEIDGKRVKVRASVSSLGGYSGHADRDQLLQFVERVGKNTREVFVVMGEPHAEMFLAQRIYDFLGIKAIVPAKNQTITIEW